MNTQRRVAWSLGRASVVFAVVVTLLTACDAEGSAERPTDPVSSTPPSQTGDPSGDPSSDPTGEPTRGGSSTPVVKPHHAAMPEVPLRYMYQRGASREGVLVSAAGITETGLRASAYVPTRTGAVFASGDQVYNLVEGGTAVAIGPVPAPSVYLQVDPTLRYVAWPASRDGLHARTLVYDVVAHRMVLDRVLQWNGRTSPLRITTFGAARLRLVHVPRWNFWTFATLSGHALATTGGQVVDLRSHRVKGPMVGGGGWSPGLRYRVSESRGRRPWQVVDLTTGRDVTPAALLGPAMRGATFTRWLGNATFGVITRSGTWRHTTFAASVCHVAGRCRVVWRLPLGVQDGGLQYTNEIG